MLQGGPVISAAKNLWHHLLRGVRRQRGPRRLGRVSSKCGSVRGVKFEGILRHSLDEFDSACRALCKVDRSTLVVLDGLGARQTVPFHRPERLLFVFPELDCVLDWFDSSLVREHAFADRDQAHAIAAQIPSAQKLPNKIVPDHQQTPGSGEVFGPSRFTFQAQLHKQKR
jgi:hypothetical protein